MVPLTAYAPTMPSRPLSPNRHATTQLHTRIDVEAIAVTKGETDRGAAVAGLATLVPPRASTWSTR